MFCQVLAKNDSDPQKLIGEIDDIHNRGSAVLGASPVPEATVEGFDFAIQALFAKLRQGRRQVSGKLKAWLTFEMTLSLRMSWGRIVTPRRRRSRLHR